MDGIKKLQLATLLGIKNGNYGSIIQSQAMFQFLNRFYDVQYSLLADKNDIINSDLIVWGGDQVFFEDIFKMMFMNIYKSSRHLKNVIFSASFGNAQIGQTVKSFLNFMKRDQNMICATRELNDYAKQLFKDQHFTVIDPALITSRDDWISRLDCKKADSCYTFGYAPCNTRDKCEKYESLGKQLGVDVNIVKFTGMTNCVYNVSHINQFLNFVYNAKTVYTKSFHCFLFAVLFNKQIKFYDEDFKTNKRVASFIDKYQIEFDNDGIIQNYCDVIERIDEDRRKSLLFLYDSVFYQIEAYVASATLNLNDCSSGGMSMVFANQIISRGGCVYGVMWKNAWEVEYTCISSMDDYCKIAGSKYIYAVPPDFREIKQKLDSGQSVMLVGLPCMIRAFQQYIFFKFYPNLILVDLLCSGIFDSSKYSSVVENALKQRGLSRDDISEVKHRWKDRQIYGCNTNAVSKDGEIVSVFENGESFGKAKSENSMKMCYSCPCGTRRQFKKVHYSDITIGDAWGIPENKNASMSKVIINSKHGQRFFDSVKHAVVFKKLPVKYVVSAY